MTVPLQKVPNLSCTHVMAVSSDIFSKSRNWCLLPGTSNDRGLKLSNQRIRTYPYSKPIFQQQASLFCDARQHHVAVCGMVVHGSLSVFSSRKSGFVAKCRVDRGGGHKQQGTTKCEASSSGENQDTELDSDNPENSALKIEQLQAELEQAVRSEDYQVAAQLRDRLRVLQEDTEAAVLAANALFYRAFASADLRLMRRVWARGDHVQCLHPGAHCISGYDLVLASWEAVLGSSRDYRVDLEDVRVHTSGGMAFVTCIEVIRSAGGAGRVLATNVFEKQEGEWRICLHHGAQAPSVLL